MRWYTNRLSLRTLARSFDPSDHFVARAQALLDDMAPLEAQLPDMLEMGFGPEAIVQRLLSIDEAGQAELIAELVDAAHLLEKGDMAKQTLSLGETSTNTKVGDPGHCDLDSALINADETFASGIQTYRPNAPDVKAVLRDIRLKMQRQLRAAPAAERTLAVHVDEEMKNLLLENRAALMRIAEDLQIGIDVVSPDGARVHFSGGMR